MKKIICLIMLFIIGFSIGCSSKLKIECDKEIYEGTYSKISVNSDEEVLWFTSDEAIAEVIDGKLLAKKIGEVTISCMVGKKTIDKKIKVLKNDFSLEIIGSEVLFPNLEVKYVTQSDENIIGDIIWESSDPTIIQIDENGIAKGIKEGKATIIAKQLSQEAIINVEVFSQDFTLEINGENEVELGEKLQLQINSNIKGLPSWSSSDTSVAIISDDGLITPLREGEVVIFATLYTKTVSKKINVIDNDPNKLKISGPNTIRLDQTLFLTANREVIWESSDSDIAEVFPDGEIYPGEIGTVTITATDKNDSSIKATFVLNIIGKTPRSINIVSKDKVGIGETISLDITTKPTSASKRVYYFSSNPLVAKVSNDGSLVGIGVGKTIITAISMEDENIKSVIEIEVTLPKPEKIILSGNGKIMQGEHNFLNVEIVGKNVCNELIWESSDPSIAIVEDGIVLGVNKGNVKVYAKSIIDEGVYGIIDIEVGQYIQEENSQEDLDKANNLLEKMTLEQKLGQMFVVGFNGTEISGDLIKAIDNYHFGNVIYMAYNVSSPYSISKLSTDIQNKMIEKNGVPAFISIDQEGGRVARLTNGGTHFISNMAIAATNDYNNTYLEGVAMGKELLNYGINVDFAPVADVNNNPENPIIGIRSYSDSPLRVSLYTKNMFVGLKDSNVLGCAKHFPGHGNTSVDSHIGLPTITTPITQLYQTELAPFISAVANGIDAIMTTHIIFSAIDSQFPATLSKTVLTDLLRKEIGYQGLIITDGMEMNAVSKNFGDYSETAVLAVKAGVDILTYTTTANPIKAYNGLMNAIKKGEITEERIDESVRRILLKKIKYNIIDDCYPKDEDISELLKENEELNINFAISSLTKVKGDFTSLDKNKKTLIISPTTTYSLGEGLQSNSFGNYASLYLKENGHKECDFLTVNNHISATESQKALEKAKDYEQIVVAFSNVKTTNLTRTINFVKSLTNLDKELVVIALDTPYDLISYGSNVKNYICIYGYQKATVIALSKYLNGEFVASGRLSISPENFK